VEIFENSSYLDPNLWCRCQGIFQILL